MSDYHKTNDPDVAVVIRIHREEIEGLGFVIPDDVTMDEIAGELEIALLNNEWWDIVRIVCEEINLPKEGIDNDDDVW